MGILEFSAMSLLIHELIFLFWCGFSFLCLIYITIVSSYHLMFWCGFFFLCLSYIPIVSSYHLIFKPCLYKENSAQRRIQLGVAKKIKNGARKIVLDKAEEARVAAFSAFKSLGLDIPEFSRPLLLKVE